MKIEGKIWRHKQWIDDPMTEVKKARVWSANDLPAATVIKELKLKGIYALEVPSLKSIYIGQSRNIQSRWSQHRYVLNKGTCEVKELQECWNNNKDLFEFKVLEITDSNLLDKEREYADRYVAKGYTLFNNYFHVTPKNIIVDEQHIPLITKLLRLITKGRISPSELDRYLDTL